MDFEHNNDTYDALEIDQDLKILIKLKNMNANLFKTLSDYLKEIDDLTSTNTNTILGTTPKKMLEKNIYYCRNGAFDILGCMLKIYLNDIVNAIDEVCHHEIEEDDIDLGTETSKRIYYCKKCEKTFEYKEKKIITTI
jgi:hypothetical protein